MKEIQLTRGKVALVDDEDYEYLNQFNWQAMPSRNTYYAVGYLDKKHRQIRMHRLILNVSANMQVDHIDHNGLNNQRFNLRTCTNKQNQMNRNPIKGFKYRGVSFYKRDNRWRAAIVINGKNKHIGYYDTEEDAARAYDNFAKKIYQEYAYINLK